MCICAEDRARYLEIQCHLLGQAAGNEHLAILCISLFTVTVASVGVFVLMFAIKQNKLIDYILEIIVLLPCIIGRLMALCCPN